MADQKSGDSRNRRSLTGTRSVSLHERSSADSMNGRTRTPIDAADRRALTWAPCVIASLSALPSSKI